MQTDKPKSWDLIAVLKTTNWTAKIKLFPEEAPLTVANFVWLSKSWYYNWITFHRVIKNFMIQWWDPTWTWAWWESFYWKEFKDEFSDNLRNIPWALSMANAWPSTNGSQFFIVHKNEASYLDWKHSVFWQVYEGLETIDKIAKTSVDSNDKPKNDVKIISVEIYEYDNSTLKESTFDADKIKEDYLSNSDIVESWDTISVHYTWTFTDWKKFDSSLDRGEPLTFSAWVWQMIKWFDDAVIGMKVWDKKSISLTPKDAYGEYDESKIEEIPKEHIWEEFDKINVWDMVNSVFWPIKAVDKTDSSITFDLNHQLCWKDLNFDIEIISIKK